MALARPQSALLAASVLTVASFLGATAYSQSRLRAVDSLSSTIATDAVPSVEFLGRGAVRLQRLRRLIHDEVSAGHARSTIETAAAELEALDEDIDRYRRLTPLPGERDLWAAIGRDLGQTSTDVRSILEALERGDAAAATTALQTRAEPAFERATSTMLRAMEHDAEQSERLARDVKEVHRRTADNIIILDVLATAVAAATTIIAARAAQAHEHLLNRHSALLADRVADLDRFAGRVAHDILSPLNTVELGMTLAARSVDAPTRAHLDRARRAMQRVQQLVEGLLQFARAGAPAESHVRTPVRTVLETIVADSAAQARASAIEIGIDCEDGVEVACSLGVLTSLIQNLVSNAIKYMGSQPTRTLALRARGSDARVRIEVEDSGPGIPPDIQTRIFEPFVRGAHGRHVPGVGLGLATVKRLVEAHGGSIGVTSNVGAGTLFWIELPRAAPAAS